MKNNNSPIVRKLTKRLLGTNKKRNFFITAAIALTTLMITSAFSIGMSMHETFAVSPFRAEGLWMHMGFGAASAEQLETLHSLDYVRHVGTSHHVGLTLEPNLIMRYVDETSWNAIQTPTFTNVIGHYARAENEIMISRAKLSHLGITDAYVGMEIVLDFIITPPQSDVAVSDYEVFEKAFVVSAIYTEFVSQRAATFTPLFVSRAFAERHGQLTQETMSVHVVFTNQNRALEYTQRLVNALQLREGQGYGTHPALGIADTGTNTIAAAVSIIAAFVMLVGFLLIYNAMYISVAKDVRFYGLLKTLGTTPKQLRRIVNGQIFRMYLTGSPIGLVLAAAISFVLVPAMIGYLDTGIVVSFSPLIYAGGAAFSLLTAYLGAFTSALKAGKISPIEAVRYFGEHGKKGENGKKLKFHLSAKAKPHRMAWRNIFREKKRAFLVIASLFLGLTVFGTVMTLVYSQDIDSSLGYWRAHDVDVFANHAIDRDIISQIAGLENVAEVHKNTLMVANLADEGDLSAVIDWHIYSSIYAEFIRDIPREIVLEHMPVGVRGIDTAFFVQLAENVENSENADIAAFERGEIAFLDADTLRIWDVPEYVADILHTQLELVVGAERLMANVVGIFDTTNVSFLSFGDPFRVVMSNVYLESRFGVGDVFDFGIITEPGTDGLVHRQIGEITAGGGMIIDSSYQARLAMEEARQAILTIGLSLSGILALIGVFNFVNVITVGLLTRKREFAILESVGMSKRQLRAVLRYEGGIYWLITVGLSATVGAGIARGLFELIHLQDPAQYPVFVYPFLPIAVVFSVIAAVCFGTAELGARGLGGLVERLRAGE
ncbi:MAG: ABC transporter permease [Defluviitaleaceae bacterium]|nr:ABC transporter permease [Defluviitaleaceae bacterium]